MLAKTKRTKFPSKSPIPKKTAIELDMPVEFMHGLAIREGNSKKPVYELHKWWARRLGTCFRMLLLGATTSSRKRHILFNGAFFKAHSLENLVVLDPFMGGGTSVVESTKFGAKVIGVDIDPVACLIAKKEIEAINESDLLIAFEKIEDKCAKKIKDRYTTRLPNGTSAIIVNAFWVDILTCLECKSIVDGHPHFRLSSDKNNFHQTVFCESCGQITNTHLNYKSFTCKNCNFRTNIDKGPTSLGILNCSVCKTTTPILKMVKKGKPLSRKLFAMEVLIDGQRRTTFIKARKADITLYKKSQGEFKKNRAKLIFPKVKIPLEGRSDSRPINHGFETYASLFNDRQLLCLSEIGKEIAKIKNKKIKEFIAIAFSDCLASNNMLCAYAFGYKKLTPLFGLHGFRKIVRPVENNVWGTEFGRGSFIKCFRKLLRAKKYSKRPYEFNYSNGMPKPIYTGETAESRIATRFPLLFSKPGPSTFILNSSSENLRKIPNKSVDLILTDPPYFDNIHYSEMSDFYHVWLRKILGPSYVGFKNNHTPFVDSLFPTKYLDSSVVSSAQGFRKKIFQIFGECRRVIKPNGLLIFTHHHRSLIAWQNLAVAVLLNRFSVKNVFPVRSEGRGGFHNSEGNLRWDAVVVARPIKKLENKNPSLKIIGKRVLNQLEYWKKRLELSNISLSDSDSISMRRAFLLKEFSDFKVNESDLMKMMADVDLVHTLPNK